jgi:hypothetical protein
MDTHDGIADREKQKNSREKPSHWHFVYHKSHMDLPGPP